MKNIYIFLIFLTITSLSNAQIKAVTDTGDEVILYNDNTWKYVNDSLVNTSITTNPKKFIKPTNATFLVKSKKVNVGVWLSTKEWKFENSGKNKPSEFTFKHRKQEIYGMLITEKANIPLENLKEIALKNAKNAAPDAHLVAQEYRNINGIDVLMLQISGTIQGLSFRYYGYYYSSDEGTVQFISYTFKNLFKDYKPEIENLINGFVILE